jgi:alpha/beta superfamily hydrolase
VTVAGGEITPVSGGGRHDGRVRDEVELFGWPQQALACRHTPAAGARAGVVVCLPAPFGGAVDGGRASRLGRRLARAGVAVQRFHYRGSPASDGDPAAITFAGLVDDARRAADLLARRTGVERIGLVGARLGALVAARVGRDHPGSPVALWEPVIDPRHVVEQAARARALAGSPVRAAAPAGSLTPAGQAPAPGPGAPIGSGSSPPAGDIAVARAPGAPAVPAVGDGHVEAAPPPVAARPLDLFDTQLCADLLHGGAVATLAEELGDQPGALLLVQTGEPTVEPDGLRPAYRALADGCRARGVPVDVACHPCDGWRDGAVVPAGSADALVEATAAWLAARLLPDPAA